MADRLRRKPSPTQRPAKPTQNQEPTRPPEPAYSLPARPPEPITVKKPQKRPTGPLGAAQRIAAKVTANKYVARLLGVMAIANDAGATLFAAALAFSTMFAIIPIVLLMAGVLGWVVDDPVQRKAVLDQMIGYVPPLQGFFTSTLEGVVNARGALSLVGVVGLLWGASAYYGSLDEVIRRIFTGGGARGELDRRVRGLVTIVILIVLVVGTVLLSSLFALVSDVVGGFAIWRYVVPLIALLAFVLVVFAVYKLVPTKPPSARAALAPAIVAGIGIGLLTNLFSVLSPLLIGGMSGFGVVATIFGALIWLNLSYQMLLYGAAWARLRRDREADRASVVEI